MDHHLIGLDWGISSFRAYLMDNSGQMIDTVTNQSGIMQVGRRSFEDVLVDSIDHWQIQYPEASIIASGMIGSRQGWFEAPYVSCPAGLAELADNLSSIITSRGKKIWFVPGVMRRAVDNTPDVMRGEETQIFGSVQNNSDRCSFILPGTHSKWALVEKGRIVWFTTFITGEIFGVLCNHSILGKLMEEDQHDDAAFLKGLECADRAMTARQGILNKLFSVRSLGLFGELRPTGLKSYLSGMLIGAEVTEAIWQIKHKTRIRLVGDLWLSGLYAKALEFYGRSSRVESENLTARGLAMIASRADLK
jgi:2-dehydro-3-deoxygalactonokinase